MWSQHFNQAAARKESSDCFSTGPYQQHAKLVLDLPAKEHHPRVKRGFQCTQRPHLSVLSGTGMTATVHHAHTGTSLGCHGQHREPHYPNNSTQVPAAVGLESLRSGKARAVKREEARGRHRGGMGRTLVLIDWNL